MRFRRKFLKNKMYAMTSTRIESRDAIVWDILPTQRICRCKIQGSDELITAWYPDNWEATPVWLKTGNAVIIRHTAGNRNRIEVMGHGQLIPTPQPGSAAAPDALIGADVVLTGMSLNAGDEGTSPGMLVIIETGTYRINGEVYSLEGITMDEATLFDMSLASLIGTVAAVIELNTESTGYVRYDRIVVGIDGIIDVVEGTSVLDTSVPSIPTLPAEHASLGYVLILGDVTDIYPQYLNASYTGVAPTILTIDIDDDFLLWSETSTDITVEVFDQYNRPITTGGIGWVINFELVFGNGVIAGAGYTGAGSNSATVVYTRFHSDPIIYPEDPPPRDISPIVKASYNDNILIYGGITLLDALGVAMIPL